jgi:hypothetical protein
MCVKPDLLHTSTHTRINDKWAINNTLLRNIVNNYPANTKFRNFNNTFSHNQMDNALYQQCFLQVITETVCVYPVTFFSEKTAKPLLNKRPFVMIGPAGSLSNLRSLGFKTFSDFWSEEYDTIDKADVRITAVVDIIEWVCTRSINELQSLCVGMEDVLNYNFNYYVNDFKKNQLGRFEDECIKNLQPRYDSL